MKLIKNIMKAKETKEQVRRLRSLRDGYLAKARECAVYDHAAGYAFWIKAAAEISNEITNITLPEAKSYARARRHLNRIAARMA